MRNILSIALLTLSIGTAGAADIRPAVVKAPVAVDPPWSWTGFYIGGNVGYSWGRSDTDYAAFNNTTGVLVASGNSKFDMNGVIGGGQIGYNWQSGAWVWGIEADIQASGQNGDATFLCPGLACNGVTFGPGLGLPVTTSFSQSLDWFGTVRGRLGATLTPSILLYVTGGLAYGGVSTDGVISGFNGATPVSSTFSDDSIKLGWTVGAGLEGRLSGNWTAKIEYLYMDLGSVSATGLLALNNPPIRVETNSDITDHILRVGINYKFGAYPVTARY